MWPETSLFCQGSDIFAASRPLNAGICCALPPLAGSMLLGRRAATLRQIYHVALNSHAVVKLDPPTSKPAAVGTALKVCRRPSFDCRLVLPLLAAIAYPTVRRCCRRSSDVCVRRSPSVVTRLPGHSFLSGVANRSQKCPEELSQEL